MTRGYAIKRYNRAVLLLSIVYAIFLVAAIIAIERYEVTGPLAYLLAILPALPIILIFAAIGRYLMEESDEYQRMLRVRQALVASGFALSLATAWGFLESFDLAGHVDAYFIAVIWFAGLGLGSCVNHFYREREA